MTDSSKNNAVLAMLMTFVEKLNRLLKLPGTPFIVFKSYLIGIRDGSYQGLIYSADVVAEIGIFPCFYRSARE
jgi:hypothetical protein